MAGAVILLGFGLNPVISGKPVSGGLIFNELTFGYLVPAILYAVLGWSAKRYGRQPYGNAAYGVAGVLGFFWITLLIRKVYQGEFLADGSIQNAELYTYSVVWLLIGLVILTVGFLKDSHLLRKVAAGLILLVVVKAFLIDMASLTGIWRALSFIGLGAALVAIGLFYQRFVSVRPAAQGSSAKSDQDV